MKCTYLCLEHNLLGFVSAYLLDNGQLWFSGYGIAKNLGHASPSSAIKLKCPHAKRLVFTETQTGDVTTYIVIQARDVVALILKSIMPDATHCREVVEKQTEPEILFDLTHAQILSRVEGTATFLARGAKPPIVLPKVTEDMRQIIDSADCGAEKHYTVINISDVRNLALQAPDQLQASKVYKWLAEHAGLQNVELIASTEQETLLNQAHAWLEQSRTLRSKSVEEPPKQQKRSSETWVAAQNMYWLKYYFKLTNKFWQALTFVLQGLSTTLNYPQRKIGGIDVYHRKVEAELLRRVETDLTFLQQYRKQSKQTSGDIYER